MTRLLVAAGNYDITHTVKSALSGSYYDVISAFSHRDALFMIRTQTPDAVLVDTAMFDRKTGDRTLTALSKESIPVALIGYTPTPVSLHFAQNAVEHSRVVFIDQLERAPLMKALSEALRIPLPSMDGSDDDQNQDTAPKSLSIWRDDEIQMLLTLSRSLLEVLDFTEVLHRTVQAARHLADAEESILLMPQGESGQLVIQAEVGAADSASVSRGRQSDPTASQVYQTGEPALITPGSAGKHKQSSNINALLYVPITVKDKRIAVLGVINRQKKTIFNRRHQDLLVQLAADAGIAIENARIHSMNLQRTNDLSALVNASQQINSSLSLETAMINICEQVSLLLNCGRVDIFHWTPSRESDAPIVWARSQRALWRVGYAPELPLKAHPGLAAALRGKVQVISVARPGIAEEIEFLHRVGAASLVTIPVAVDGQPLGLVLAYYVKHQETPPSLDAIQKAQAIGIELLSLQVHSGDIYHRSEFRSADDVNLILKSDWVEFALLGQDRRSLLTLISMGRATWLEEPYIDPALNLFGGSLETLRDQKFIRASANGDTSTLGTQAMLEAVNGRSMLGVPLTSQGETVGFMLIIDTERTRAFSERETQLAMGVAAQASTAIKNAELIRQLKASYQDLKTAQERLVGAARLSAMGELAGAVAHQVNNPLTTIVLDAELLLLKSSVDDKSREALEAILRSGKRAAAVVRRLLTTVHKERTLSVQTVNLVETIEETLLLIRAHVQREGIEVRSEINVNGTPFMVAVREDLNDLWLNLLLNAHDALRGRKRGAMGVIVQDRTTDDQVEVIVWDNGIGIPAENLDRIFEPFFTTKPAGEGTGLGLHICRQILDRIGGSVRVESRVGTGSRFIVRLPLVKE